MKIVINKCYGGYGLSIKAIKQLIKLRSKVIEKTPASSFCGGKAAAKSELSRYKNCGDGYKTSFGSILYKAGVFYTVDRYMRTDPKLIKVVEKLGEKANGDCAELKVIEIPDGIEYEISEYDGIEHIAEAHRTWG